MKKFSLIIVLLLLSATVIFAQEPVKSDVNEVKQESPIEILTVAKNSEQPAKQEPIVEKSGCCSWHGGVCGCEGGRQKCCDGTLSPSCTCGN